MPFRNPVYLDTELLSNLADYFDISVPGKMDVTRRRAETGQRAVGVDKIVTARADKQNESEITETYSVTARPVRIFNDLVDQLEQNEDLADLRREPDASLSPRSLLAVEGELVSSLVNEVGAITARFFPILMQQMASGAQDFNPSTADVASVFMTDSMQSTPQLYEVLTDQQDLPKFVVIIDPRFVMTDSMDDFESDFDIVGSVDRVVAERSSVSLERYILPGLPRATRRALGKNKIAEMVAGLENLVGRSVSSDDLELKGPAVLIRPLAIF